MGLFADIFVSFIAVLLLYVLFRTAFSLFAEKELENSAVRRINDTFVIYAAPESLEYYLRMSLLLDRHTKVIVNIDKNAPDSEELSFIAGNLSKKSDNIKIRYI
ncbi:MAG: hypothetical protein ACI4QR_03375 [Eubacteriales bacterium]